MNIKLFLICDYNRPFSHLSVGKSIKIKPPKAPAPGGYDFIVRLFVSLDFPYVF